MERESKEGKAVTYECFGKDPEAGTNSFLDGYLKHGLNEGLY